MDYTIHSSREPSVHFQRSLSQCFFHCGCFTIHFAKSAGLLHDVANGDVLALDVVVDKCVPGDVYESLGPCEDRLVYSGDGQLIVIVSQPGG